MQFQTVVNIKKTTRSGQRAKLTNTYIKGGSGMALIYDGS